MPKWIHWACCQQSLYAFLGEVNNNGKKICRPILRTVGRTNMALLTSPLEFADFGDLMHLKIFPANLLNFEAELRCNILCVVFLDRGWARWHGLGAANTATKLQRAAGEDGETSARNHMEGYGGQVSASTITKMNARQDIFSTVSQLPSKSACTVCQLRPVTHFRLPISCILLQNSFPLSLGRVQGCGVTPTREPRAALTLVKSRSSATCFLTIKNEAESPY